MSRHEFNQRLAATKRASHDLYRDIERLYVECNLPFRGVGDDLDQGFDLIDSVLDEVENAGEVEFV